MLLSSVDDHSAQSLPLAAPDNQSNSSEELMLEAQGLGGPASDAPEDGETTEALLQQTLMQTESMPSIRSQAILTQVGQTELAFPSHWVDEVMILNRSQVYTLPFYPEALVGVLHHQGGIVPLMKVPEMLLNSDSVGNEVKQENFRAIRLNQEAGQFSGVGIVVESIKGTCDLTALDSASLKIFDPEALSTESCQPQRWFAAQLAT